MYLNPSPIHQGTLKLSELLLKYKSECMHCINARYALYTSLEKYPTKQIIMKTRLIFYPFMLCFLFCCVDKKAQVKLDQLKAQQELEDFNKSIIERYWEGKWNERRIEILDELQTPDVQYHGTSESMNGLEEYRQAYDHYRTGFQDTRIEIVELIAEGDRVMSRVILHGTHNGELGGIPPSGKEIHVNAFTVFRLIYGKIAEEWEVIDQLGMMMQIGMELQMKESGE
jgi:steroid delta-isomerase-like uncharacterized protein